MKGNKVLSLVGLATKAGKTVSGEFATEKAVKTGRAQMVIVSEEASGNTKKKFQNMCTWYQVPVYVYGTRESLGAAAGREFRMTMAVTDPGLSDLIRKQMTLVSGGSEYVENESI